jgi:hypothetical protein
MQKLIGIGLTVLLSIGVSYATDCTTSFDHSCLSWEYNGEQVAADQEQRQKDLEDFQKAKAEQEVAEAEAEVAQTRKEAKERQHRERLAVEIEKARALYRIGDRLLLR